MDSSWRETTSTLLVESVNVVADRRRMWALPAKKQISDDSRRPTVAKAPGVAALSRRMNKRSGSFGQFLGTQLIKVIHQHIDVVAYFSGFHRVGDILP